MSWACIVEVFPFLICLIQLCKIQKKQQTKKREGYPGVAGMVILKAQSYEEAEEICKLEPLVAEGYATYKLRTLQVADKDNDYLR